MRMKINGPAFLSPWEGRKVFLREAHENGVLELVDENGLRFVTLYGRFQPAGSSLSGRFEIEHKRLIAKFLAGDRTDLVTEDQTFDLYKNDNFILGPIVEFT